MKLIEEYQWFENYKPGPIEHSLNGLSDSLEALDKSVLFYIFVPVLAIIALQFIFQFSTGKGLEKIWTPFCKFLQKIEGFVLISLLASMVLLAFSQIVLTYTSRGLAWALPLIRASVLWIGVFGASLATQQRSHIKFDILAKFLPRKAKEVVGLSVNFTCIIVMVFLTNAAYRFMIQMKMNSQEYLVEGLPWIGKLPEWVAMSILPIGFSLIAIKFMMLALEDIATLFRARQGAE
ncbi:MAG: TRAP transporter small permease subunit [Deltaproteobacteria bacterium]|nr:TRAP transporter small permease subunit [Deltaproteobacteria bacterium]